MAASAYVRAGGAWGRSVAALEVGGRGFTAGLDSGAVYVVTLLTAGRDAGAV